jgi:hypothetical protein
MKGEALGGPALRIFMSCDTAVFVKAKEKLS